jgi:hypothetical protein
VSSPGDFRLAAQACSFGPDFPRFVIRSFAPTPGRGRTTRIRVPSTSCRRAPGPPGSSSARRASGA